MRRNGVFGLLVGACVLVGACFFAGPASAACPQEGCDTDPPNKVTLTVTVSGSGTVKNGTATICGGGVCERSFEEGQSVSLSATPGTGMTFMGWGGDCTSTSGSCNLTMDEDRSVTATFQDVTPPEVPTITFPTAGQKIESVSGEVNVKFAEFDGSATSFRCRVDVNASVGATSCSPPTWSTGPLAVGTHTVYVWADDSVGNRSAPASRMFEIVPLQESGGTPSPPPAGVGTPLPTGTIRAPAPPATARLSTKWKVRGAWTYVRKLLVADLPPQARVRVRCTGLGCPFKQKKPAVRGDRATVTPLFGKHALHAGVVIELRIDAPGRTPKVFDLKIRSGKRPKLISR